ncbi:hypothetical protein Tco_1002601 [Tanacetum coccineum]|uniref:Uncharacterized protein n=1 Tax=Tanacetum coccineum TaxID=301880 RepID=A0ABQ5F6S2_9ASTR
MQKNLELIAKYFKKIYKPTNNNLKTSSNTRNKNVDTTLKYKNDNQSRQFGNQRTMIVVGAKETVEQSDWLADTDENIDEQELEAHYTYMAKIQEVLNADSCTDSDPLEQVQYDTGYNVFANEIQHSEQSESFSNTWVVETGDRNVITASPDMCDNDIQNDQNDVECDNERVALANLIANLKLDVNENKNIQKQLKKANITLANELTYFARCKQLCFHYRRLPTHYVPGPEHADDEIVAEDQPDAEDASPTAQSPDYVPESDPEADPEEDDDEDPEEDPVDYPADGGDNRDDEDEPSGGG